MNEVAAMPSGGGLKWILAGCCGCLFVGLISLSSVGGLLYVATKAPAEAAHEHVDLVKAGLLREAYEATGSGYRATADLEAFEAFVAAHPVLYAGRDLTLSWRQIENAEATVRGTTTGPDGATLSVRFTLKQEGERWRVQGVWVGEGDGD